jgi:hypothetical protein
MFYYVLNNALERDVKQYAHRHCRPGDCVIQRSGMLTVAFGDEDRARLFLNLFDDEIEHSFELPGRSAA